MQSHFPMGLPRCSTGSPLSHSSVPGLDGSVTSQDDLRWRYTTRGHCSVITLGWEVQERKLDLRRGLKQHLELWRRVNGRRVGEPRARRSFVGVWAWEEWRAGGGGVRVPEV